jgi:hypothetical protein
MTALLATQALIGDAVADERAKPRDLPILSAPQSHSGRTAAKEAMLMTAPLDRVAHAVDAAESSHGTDVAMWRPDPSGPQGPMQVTEAAAIDVGGGDRFDMMRNREIGRAYLSQLFWHYGNWPDAIAAYNWGIGKMDAWVRAGRPPEKFLAGVAVYTRRVLHESGLCSAAESGSSRQQEDARQHGVALPDALANPACSTSDAVAGPSGFGGGPSRLSKRLHEALQLALQRAAQDR